MINTNGDDFVEDIPLTAPVQSSDEPSPSLPEAPERRRSPQFSAAGGETWAQTREKVGDARRRTEVFLRENPVPTIVGALVFGLAIGWALRHATMREEKALAFKSPGDHLDLSFLSLPFLWPFFKSVKEKYEDSAEAVKDGVDRLKKIDVEQYTKPVRKRWKAWTR